MAFSTRRGRPARGNRDACDHGTPELQFKRALGLTNEPIDVCLEKGIITADHHWSGLHLRWLYTLRYGAPVVTTRYSDELLMQAETQFSPDWRAARELEYQEAVLLLQQARRHDCILRLCIFNEIPAFLNVRLAQRARTEPALADQLNERRTRIIEGLDILTSQWRRDRRSHSNRM